MKLFQKPNPSFIIAFFGLILATLSVGTFHQIGVIIVCIAGTIWSYEEVKNGVNRFRKLLGVAGIILISVYLFQQIK